MSKRKDWNPELYLKFESERTKPSIDLVSKIVLENPKKIIDIGCGPGNSTSILFNRWPNSKIVGIDNSYAMIEAARKTCLNIEWKAIDIREFGSDEKYDIVFSNAAIQWIPNHKELINHLLDMTADDGVLALQIPQYDVMPVSHVVEKVSTRERWKSKFANIDNLLTIHESAFYYNILSNKVKILDLWETSYYHIMDSHQGIIDMLRSTGIKPFMDRLVTDEEKTTFEKEILDEISLVYPVQEKRRVLFPFKRLFLIGYK